MSMPGMPYPLGAGRASGTEGMTEQEAMMVRGVRINPQALDSKFH
jgi:hypothetical protein